MRALAVALMACVLSGCAYDSPTAPTQPAEVVDRIVLASTPSVVRLALTDYLCVGGFSMAEVAVQGYASDGHLRGIPRVPVHWSSPTLLIVPDALWTDHTGRATAEISTDGLGVVSLTVTAGDLHATASIQPKTVEFCLNR